MAVRRSPLVWRLSRTLSREGGGCSCLVRTATAMLDCCTVQHGATRKSLQLSSPEICYLEDLKIDYVQRTQLLSSCRPTLPKTPASDPQEHQEGNML